MNNTPIFFDCEVYPDYFLFGYKELGGAFQCIDTTTQLTKRDIRTISRLFFDRVTVGFNSLSYDLQILSSAFRGSTCQELYHLSNSIIAKGTTPLYYDSNIRHIDIKKIAVGIGVGLKIYGCRLHTKIVENFSFDNTDKTQIKKYCDNDLNMTIELYNKHIDRIELRYSIDAEYNINTLAKSDQQIVEVILKRVLHPNYQRVTKSKFKIRVPQIPHTNNKEFEQVKALYSTKYFTLDSKSKIVMPDDIKKLVVNIGQGTYQLGIGGLHSSSDKKSFFADDNTQIVDIDARSYYPSLVLKEKIFPPAYGQRLLGFVKRFFNERIEAIANNNETKSKFTKLVLNGVVGKFADPYSSLFSPKSFLEVTVAGQLWLLYLIVKINDAGIDIISANTDGITVLLPTEKKKVFDTITSSWQQGTGFQLSHTYYKKICLANVNNYIAVGTDDSVKTKGIFSLGGLTKHVAGDIISKAVIAYVKDGTPVEDTIRSSTDIRDFIFMRSSKDDIVYEGDVIGKVVRWIHTTNGKQLRTAKGNLIAGSDNCLPVMVLPDTLPCNIDYDRYIHKAYKQLINIGLNQVQESLAL